MSLKKFKKQIVDKKRINEILKKIKKNLLSQKSILNLKKIFGNQ